MPTLGQCFGPHDKGSPYCAGLQDPRQQTVLAAAPKSSALVESRMGAVAWGHWPTPRFPSPLIEPDVRSYRIRLSDWLHPRPTAGQVEAGVLGTALRGSDGSHRT